MINFEDLPERLRLKDEDGNEKPTLSDFKSDEEFYRSFQIGMGMRKGKVTDKFPGCTLRFPECSVDWSRIALPEDRWIYKPDFGIVVLSIKDCPWIWSALHSIQLDWKHSPQKATEKDLENYSHCDIEAISDIGQQLDENFGMNEETRKQFRVILGRAIRVYKNHPKPASP